MDKQSWSQLIDDSGIRIRDEKHDEELHIGNSNGFNRQITMNRGKSSLSMLVPNYLIDFLIASIKE